MSWPMVKLDKVITFIRGVTFKPDDQVSPFSQDSVVVMRTKNVQMKGLDTSDLIAIPKSLVKRQEQMLIEGDILMSSANSWELVGKSSYVENLGYISTAGGFISIVRAKKDMIYPRYLFHWIMDPKNQHNIRYCGRKTTNISNLDVSRFKELQIPLPPLEEQKRIAAILDKADAIRQKRKQAIELADEFLRSVFLDMFGDPVANPKGWEVSTLNTYGSFKNGMNFSKGEVGNELHCIGVGDFKSFDRISGTATLSTIHLNDMPDKGYLLQNNDLLFVRSNGNKALVGRCVSVHPGDEEITYSGFCIRYRIEKTECLEADFVNYCLRIPSMNHAMLKGGQGANIQNINQQTLSALAFPIPPFELQKEFSSIVQSYRAATDRVQKVKSSSNELFNALSQKAFSGQL